ATRRMMRSLTSAIAHRPLLDALLVARALDDVLHENPWRDDVIRIDGAGLDELLDFRDRHAARRRHHRIEVARGAPVHEVAGAVAFPRLDEGEVCPERRLEHVRLAPDRPRFLALGDDRPVAGGREESADAGAGGAYPFGEGSLRNELDLQLPAQKLPLELLVLADVGRDHLRDLTPAQQDPEAEVVDARVVADERQPFRSAVAQRVNEIFGDAAETEAADENARTVGDEGDRLLGRRQHLVHPSIIPGGRSGFGQMRARDVADRRRAHLAHREHQLRAQYLQDALDARLAERGQAPDVRPSDADGAR